MGSAQRATVTRSHADSRMARLTAEVTQLCGSRSCSLKMNRFQKIKQKNQKKILQKQIDETQKKLVRGALSLIGILMALTFIFGDHGLLQLYKLKKEKNKIQNHITNFREKKEKLVSEKHRLENDIDYIEKLAREKYRMAKPGEKVFKVIDSNKKTKKE